MRIERIGTGIFLSQVVRFVPVLIFSLTQVQAAISSRLSSNCRSRWWRWLIYGSTFPAPACPSTWAVACLWTSTAGTSDFWPSRTGAWILSTSCWASRWQPQRYTPQAQTLCDSPSSQLRWLEHSEAEFTTSTKNSVKNRRLGPSTVHCEYSWSTRASLVSNTRLTNVGLTGKAGQ